MGGSHPIFRFGRVLACGSLATITLVVSALANLHSVTWLLAFYATLGFLFRGVRSRTKSPLHSAFVVYLTTLTLYLFLVWMLHVNVPGPDYNGTKSRVALLVRLLCTGGIFNAVAHFRFTIHFADKKWKLLTVFEILGWAASGYFALLNATNHFIDDYIWGGFTWVPALHGAYIQFFWFTTIFLSIGILVPIAAVLVEPAGRKRLQLFYYILGAGPLWIACWGNFLISWGIKLYPAGGIFFLIHIAILSYAVFRHKLFDITFVIRRGLAYAAVTLVLGMLYGALVAVISMCTDPQTNRIASTVLSVMAAGFIFAPLLEFVQKQLDRFFFRDVANRHRMLEQFARNSASTVRLNKIAESLCEILSKSFKPRRILMYLFDEESERAVLYGTYTDRFTSATWPEGECASDDVVCAIRNGQTKILALTLRTIDASDRITFQLKEEQASLVVSITNNAQTLGGLIVESKKSDESYDEDDIRFAEMLAAHSSVALSNARSFAFVEYLQELTSQMLEGLTVGVVLLNCVGEVLRYNLAAAKVVSDSGQPVKTLDYFPEPIAAWIRECIEQGKQITNAELEIQNPRSLFLLLAIRRLKRSTGSPLYLILINDITEYKNMEQSRQRESGLVTLGEKLSSINHELANALQPVCSQIDRLEDFAIQDVHAGKRIRTIAGQVSHVQKLLTNLKDLGSPIDLRRRSMEISPLIQGVWLDVIDHCNSTLVAFQTQTVGECICFADGAWMQRVFYNLLKNAVESLKERPEPRICVDIQQSKTFVKVKISDNGCGIDEGSKVKLFEPFYSTKKGCGGTGLGLSISRRIVELHEGSIEFESQAGIGTTFVLHLPVPKNASSPVLST